jgi:SAM-dependent methyltransferase
MKDRKDIYKYWATQRKGHNRPSRYRYGRKKSEFLVKVFNEIPIPKGNLIMELGCNVGRNLHYLQEAGYHRLVGIELNKKAVELSKEYFPDLRASIFQGLVEDILPMTKRADVIFTMAFLCHVHPDVEWIVFDEMMRLARRYIITIEDEIVSGRRHEKRHYPDYFKGNFELVHRREKCPGLYWPYKLSIFKRVR